MGTQVPPRALDPPQLLDPLPPSPRSEICDRWPGGHKLGGDISPSCIASGDARTPMTHAPPFMHPCTHHAPRHLCHSLPVPPSHTTFPHYLPAPPPRITCLATCAHPPLPQRTHTRARGTLSRPPPRAPHPSTRAPARVAASRRLKLLLFTKLSCDLLSRKPSPVQLVDRLASSVLKGRAPNAHSASGPGRYERDAGDTTSHAEDVQRARRRRGGRGGAGVGCARLAKEWRGVE